MFQMRGMVKLKRDLPAENLCAGMVGTVVMVFDEPDLPRAYEVEFLGEDVTTSALCTIKEKDLEKASSTDL